MSPWNECCCLSDSLLTSPTKDIKSLPIITKDGVPGAEENAILRPCFLTHELPVWGYEGFAAA